MVTEISSIYNRIQGLSDNKNIYIRDDGSVKTSSKFSFFRFNSKRAENNKTVQEFINSIENSEYKEYKSIAKGILDRTVANGKPLKIRNITEVLDNLETKRVADLEKAQKSAARLEAITQLARTGVLTNNNDISLFNSYCNSKNITFKLQSNTTTFSNEDKGVLQKALADFLCKNKSEEIMKKYFTAIGTYPFEGFMNVESNLNDFAFASIEFDSTNSITKNIGENYAALIANKIDELLARVDNLVPNEQRNNFLQLTNAMATSNVKTHVNAIAYVEDAINSGSIELADAFDFAKTAYFARFAMPEITSVNARQEVVELFQVNKASLLNAQSELEKNGLPKYLASSLMENVDFATAVDKEIAKHPNFAELSREEKIEINHNCFKQFLANNLAEIKEYITIADDEAFMKNAIEKNYSPKRNIYPSVNEKKAEVINYYLATKGIANSLASKNMTIGGSFVADIVKRIAVSNAHSKARIDYGTDDNNSDLALALRMQLKRLNFQTTNNTAGEMRTQLSKFTGELANINDFVGKEFGKNAYKLELSSSSILNHTLNLVNEIIKISNNEEVFNSDEMLIDNMTEDDFVKTFMEKPAPTQARSELFMRYAEELGVSLSQDKVITTVMSKYISAEGNAKPALTNLLNKMLGSEFEKSEIQASLEKLNLNLDVDKVKAESYLIGLNSKFNKSENITLSQAEEILTKSLEEKALKVADAVKFIAGTNSIPQEIKQSMINSVLANGTTEKDILMNVGSYVNKITKDKSLSLANAGVSLPERLQGFITKAADTLNEMTTKSFYFRNVQYVQKLKSDYIQILLDAQNLSLEDRQAIATEMQSKEMKNFVATTSTLLSQSFIPHTEMPLEAAASVSFDESDESEDFDDFYEESNSYSEMKFENDSLKLSMINTVIGLVNSENGLSSNIEPADINYSEKITDYKQISPSIKKAFESILESSRLEYLLTPFASAMQNFSKNFSADEVTTLNGIYDSLVSEYTENKDKIASLILINSEKLLSRTKQKGKALSGAEVYMAICNVKMPSKASKKNLSAYILNEVNKKFQSISELVTNANLQNRVSLSSLNGFISPELYAKFHLQQPLTKEDIMIETQLPPLTQTLEELENSARDGIYNMLFGSSITAVRKTGFSEGLYIINYNSKEEARKDQTTAIQLIDTLAQTEIQKMRILQTLSDDPRKIFMKLENALDVKYAYNRTELFTYNIRQQEDDSVLVTIDISKDEARKNIVYTIATNGSVTCNDINFKK